MPRRLHAAMLDAAWRDGAAQRHIYSPGCAAHSHLFEAWWSEAPAQARATEFCGVFVPGVNRFDFAALDDSARMRLFFQLPDFAASAARGAIALVPMHYSAIPAYLARPGHFDGVLVQVSPPDRDGNMSLGLAADFALAAMASGAPVWAHVNPDLPVTRGPVITPDAIDAWVEQAAPLLTVAPEEPDSTLNAVAAHVARLVRDGDTLQFGLGKLQTALCRALTRHRGLRLFTGMVSDGLLTLLEHGALAPRDRDEPPVVTAVALGTATLYQAVTDPALIRFAPVSETHALQSLARLPRFTAVNSALSIDLYGQVNGEMLDGRQVSGAGGIGDFSRGALASALGRGIIALPATARGGQVSRIVTRLDGPVSLARADVDHVVTEFGLAALRGLDEEQRASALIAIAAPSHRAALRRAWDSRHIASPLAVAPDVGPHAAQGPGAG